MQPSNGGYLTIIDSTVINNFTYRSGGGLYLVNHDAQVQITDSVFSENRARHGGSILISSMTPSSTTEILRTQITDNTARGDGGGIHVTGGRLQVADSNILRNVTDRINTGGGIRAYEVDQLIIDDCVIEENLAGEYVGGFGGGIDFRQGGWDGELIIQDTLLANNRAARGGAVAITDSSFTFPIKDQVLLNSTISGNESFGGGGGIWTEDDLTIAHSTITDNASDINHAYGGSGGGIYVESGVATLDHTIVAGNLDNTGAAHDVDGAYASSFSLVGEGGDFLGALANNGGFTRSHALLPGSPAIDAGDPAATPDVGGVPIYDQRGSYFDRVFEGGIDIGAYEWQHLGGSQTWVVDTLVDEKDGDYSTGDLSLREAIGLANANPGFSDNILFDTGLDGGTVLLTLGELIVVDSLTIDADNLSNGLTIDASGNDPTPGIMRDDGSRIMLINDGSSAVIDVEIRGLTLTGGDLFGSGGAIFSVENLSIRDSLITGNAAKFDAGGIYTTSPLHVTGSTISGNTAGRTGGGVHSSGYVDVINSNFSNNSADSDAGGIYNSDTLVVRQSTISNNSAGDSGGGIFASGSINIVNSDVWSNTAGAEGGGIVADTSTVQITDSSFIGNSAGSRGGAIFASLGSLVLSRSDVASNSANSDGGGISLIFNASTITNSSIVGNTAGGIGGGIKNSSGPLILNQSTVSGNAANRNAGGVYNSLSTAEILDSTISGNWTAMNGGGIYTFLGTVEVLGSTISGNSADINAGGIAVGLFSDSSIRHSTITNNTSDADNNGVGNGGGILTPNNATVLDHTLVAGNRDNSGQAPEIAGSVISNFSLIGIGVAFLGTLADNGGPTLTHALLAGSPAIDTGDTTLMAGVGDTPNFDQRGVPFSRIAGPRIDIGAVEQADAPIIVDTLIDGSDGDYSRFDVSLREAIELANNQPGANTIAFDPSLFANGPETILVTTVGDTGPSGIGSAFRIRGETTILGPGAALLTIDVSTLDPTPDENNGDGIRGFRIDDDHASQAKVLISGMTLTGGDITYFNVYNGGGGAIHSTENLELQSVHVVDNSSKYGGGIISVGDLTINDSLFADNESDWGGGAIKIYGSSLVITHSTFSHNQTSREGGGINLEKSIALIEESTFTNNSASQGGGLYFSDSEATIRNLLITANTAGSYGGGISIEDSNLAIFDTSIVDNTSGRAAGISSSNSGGNYLVTMSNSLVARNISDNDGGGMRLLAGEYFISNSTISQNQTGGSGGGIQFSGATLTLAHSTVTGNIARLSKSFGAGGGISMQYLSATGLPNNLYLEHSIVAGNTDLSNAAPDIAFTTLSPSPVPTKMLTSSFSHIGDNTGAELAEAPLGFPDANGNLIGGPIHGAIDAMLGELTDNGGLTLTHALLPGSPAIDAGDPSFTSPPDYDQRGFSFARVVAGRIDIGAFESGATSADFDSDGNIDGFDFLAWQRGFGTTSVIHVNGDANVDGAVDDKDLDIWANTFGLLETHSLAAVDRGQSTWVGEQSVNSKTALAVSGELVEPKLLALQSQQSEAVALANLSADLIDAALALELLDNWPDEKGQPLIEESILGVLFLPQLGEVELSTRKASREVDSKLLEAASDEVGPTVQLWLTDELLEHVFS